MRRQVFICYRRTDADAYAGRLYDALSKDFGAKDVFFDSGGGITAGDDWKTVIEERLASCAVLVALIGPNWQPERLTDPDDFVRREISGALAVGVRVIPIVVNDAKMPRQADLPEDLRPLLGRQMQEMTDRHWRADYEQLATAIRNEIKQRRRRRITAFLRSRILRIGLVVAIVSVLAAIAINAWNAWNAWTAAPSTRPSGTSSTVTMPEPVHTAPSQLEGLNLSVNGEIRELPANIDFVFVNVRHKAFKETWAQARARGLVRGAYWTYRADSPPSRQVDEFLSSARPEPGDLIAVTIAAVARPSSRLNDDLHRCLSYLEGRTGKRPIIYATSRMASDFPDDTFGNYPLWLLEMDPDGPPPSLRGWSRPTFIAREPRRVFELGLAYDLTFRGTRDELTALGKP